LCKYFIVQPISIAIRALRKRKNLSQKDLADLCGLKYQSVQKWENGTGKPTVAQLPLVAKALGIPVTDLIEGIVPEIGPDRSEHTHQTQPKVVETDVSKADFEKVQYELKVKELELEMERRVNSLQSELLKYKEKELQEKQREIEHQRALRPD
jgi:transcriptional regulator with XRE-family HTH domain